MTAFDVAQAPSTGADDARTGVELVVTDPSGAVVPKAQVRVAKRNGGHVTEKLTNEYGKVQFAGLAADNYAITVSAAGFLPNTQSVSVPGDGLIRVGTVLQIAHMHGLVHVGGPNHPIVMDTICPPCWDNSPFDLYRRPRPVWADVEILRPSHP